MSLENTAANIDGDEEEFVDELTPGTQLMHGQYTIESFLAAGGFGITYLARDSLDRRVVIKECFPGSFCRRQNCSVTPRSRAHQNELKSIVRLFTQEAQSLAKATHPNIVHVHQVFNENNTAYMALDFVNGRDLLEILEEDSQSLQPDVVEGYLVKILDAIGHIHKLGILHRDISPDNIIIDESGEPVLIDFGAARESRNENASRLLSALRVVKDGYSPQEFYITGGEQTPSCDLYSLAASFYHLITGDLPPDSQIRLTSRATEEADPYVPLAQRTEAYTENFVDALDKAISIMPRERMQSAEEWLTHLKDGAVAPAPQAAPVRATTPAAPAERHGSAMSLILATTAIVALLGVGAFYMTAGNKGAPASGTQTATSAAPEAPRAEATIPAPLPRDASSEVASTETAAIAPTPAPVATPAADPVAPVVATTHDLPPVEDVQTSIATLVTPSFDETAEENLTPSLTAASIAFTRPNPRPMIELVMAEASSVDTLPHIGLNPTDAQVKISEADKALQSSVEFFVSMAKEQPKLVTAPARRIEPVVVVEEPSPTTEDALAAIMTGFGAAPPFTLSPWQAGVVASVEENGPDWLTPNADIVSINGAPMTTNDDISQTLNALASADDASTFEVTLGVEPRGNQPVFERTITMNKEKQILLLNGLRFMTRENNGVWITEVVEAPTDSAFKVGDRLLSYVESFENIDGPDSLQTILDDGLAQGKTNFGFAVSRNGETWVEQLSLASNAN